MVRPIGFFEQKMLDATNCNNNDVDDCAATTNNHVKTYRDSRHNNSTKAKAESKTSQNNANADTINYRFTTLNLNSTPDDDDDDDDDDNDISKSSYPSGR